MERRFGGISLKQMLKVEKAFGKIASTCISFKNLQSGSNLASEMKQWISRIHEYDSYSNPEFEHGFFVKTTKGPAGFLNY